MGAPPAIPSIRRARDLIADRPRLAGWSHGALSGYLTELVGGARSANVSLAARLILEAQRAGELVAWIATREDVFFPPDFAAAGIDLSALPVIRAAEPAAAERAAGLRSAGAAIRAAERLLRSGAFGLLIIDLAHALSLPVAGQGRLLRLAERHDAQVLILRRQREDGVYSGSLVTVRAQSVRERVGSGRFRCTIRNTKDKREGPGWTTSGEFDGPPGVC